MAAQVKLPYLASPGVIPKIFSRIREARRPDRFTQDFLETKLGHSGGSARAIIPLMKRMGFISADGTPTSLYDKFRNPGTSSAAVAVGMRTAYAELFDRNQYANDLTRDKLKNLILEMTGLEKDNTVANLIVSTFWTLKAEADFEAPLGDQDERAAILISEASEQKGDETEVPSRAQAQHLPSGVDFRVG